MAHDPQPPTQDPAPYLASRRSVVKAAWSAPVIVALGMNPIAAFARGAGSSTDMGGSAAPIEKPKQGNNGFGNGDQDAPGNSGSNNNAENGPGGNHNGKGKNSANSGNNKNR